MVYRPVIGHDHVGFFADFQKAGADIDTLAREKVDFLEQHFRVDHHAVSDQAKLFLEDAGGDQVADKLLVVDYQRVPCVVSP